MSDDQEDGTDDEARAGLDGASAQVLSGSFRGQRWQAAVGADAVPLTIDGRQIPIVRDEIGSYVSHAMVGRWPDIEELAVAILRWHPDYSRWARPRVS